jgi:hypothetical protein
MGAPTAAATATPPPADSSSGSDPVAVAQASSASASSAAEPSTTFSPQQSVEPFRLRLAGRPIPVAGILFWGGMVLGMGLKFVLPPMPEGEAEFWRSLPWVMIWCGVLWFAVTEFGALMKNKLSRH